MSSPNDDLKDAPPEVREAAAYVEKHRVKRTMWTAGIVGALLSGVLATVVLHDVAGVSEVLSAVPVMLGLATTGVGLVWGARGPLVEVGRKEAMVDRYRKLRELGLTWAAPADPHMSPIDRIVARIAELAVDRPDIRTAAEAARARAARLQGELQHLEALGDTALTGPLIQVRDRLQAEVARINAHLAETYAALMEMDAARDGADAQLGEALAQLTADREVETADLARRAALQARQRAGS